MKRFLDARIVVPGLALAGALLLVGFPADSADEPAGDTATQAAGYAGSQSCIECHEHEGRSKELQLTLHGKSRLKDWDGGTDCEACHGPGAAHVRGKGKSEGMQNPGDMSPLEVNELCVKCHDGSQHANWQGGAHDGRGMSCLTCHQIHPENGEVNETLLIESDVLETCTQCHLQKKASLVRSSHMPLREGSMTCTSCHNPHGSNGPSQLRQLSVNDNCYACHAEKRSPVLWEHAPVKENCLTCHDPHGTMHPNLLKMRTPRLCQQCHDEARHPTQPYDSAQSALGNAPFEARGVPGPYSGDFFPGTRLINHGCANCHSQIHGSNHPAGSRFLR